MGYRKKDPNTEFRVYEMRWFPETKHDKKVVDTIRKESARMWNEMAETDHCIRMINTYSDEKWPHFTKQEWRDWSRVGGYKLHSQTVQEIIDEYLEAIKSTSNKRKKGHQGVKYPSFNHRFRSVPYKSNQAKVKDDKITLPNVLGGKLTVRLPEKGTVPEKISEARLDWGRILIVYQVPAPPRSKPSTTIGVDLGVNTLIAASDGSKAVLISGKRAKAINQWRNKKLSELQSAQSRKIKGSRRWNRLQDRKVRMLQKSKYQLKYIIHKSTRIIANEFPGARCIVGEPFNDAARKCRSKEAQQISEACNRKIINLLKYKLNDATEIDERYTSKTCPQCGNINRGLKGKRVHSCECGMIAPRDVVGSVNILVKGTTGSMQVGTGIPPEIKYRHV